MKRLAGFGFAAVLAVCGAHASAADPAATLAFYNGVIHSGDAAHPKVEAVAVRGETIVYTGPQAGLAAWTSAATQMIDLHGASLYPGLTDAHVHLEGVGERALAFDLTGTPSIKALQTALTNWAKAHPGSGVIHGAGWIETFWPEKRFPTAADLDAAVSDRPVILDRIDGHAVVVNSAALKAAHIDSGTADPSGGRILRTEQGAPAGMFVDNAQALVTGLIPPPSDAELKLYLKTGMQLYASWGWTGGHNMAVSWREVRALEDLAASGEAPIKVYNAVIDVDSPSLFASGPRSVANGRVITRAIKMFADGSLGSRGAALLAPYSDEPSTSGLVILDHDKALVITEHALKSGLQVTTHAIGDRGNHMVLDLYQEALTAVPTADARLRIEHAQNLIPADLDRFKSLGVVASMRPSHAISDLHFAPKRLGLERLSEAYAWKPLMDRGVIVAAGSDAPVEAGDPRVEFYAASFRRDLKGYAGEGWHLEYAVDRPTALKMLTQNPAYASFRENELGSITVGKRADFSVFSADFFTATGPEILAAKPLLTVVDGQVVFRAKAW